MDRVGGSNYAPRVHRFALIDAENAESLGVVAFVRSDFKIGQTDET
jgi:hypothetical protein